MTTLRPLFRAPLLSTTVTLTFLVATAILAIVFALTWHILVRELPFPDSERLVFLWNRYGAKEVQNTVLSAPAFNDYRGLRAFESAAAWQIGNATLTAGEPRRVSVARVTPDYFRVFGANLRFGETDAVMLSEGLARALGRPESVVVDGRAMSVAGVVPSTFTIPPRIELWMPLNLTAADFADANRGAENLAMAAKLRPGVSVRQAQAEVDVVTRAVFDRVPARVEWLKESRWHVAVVGMRDDLVRRARPALLMLLAAALLVALLAAANVLGLFLARTVARRKELAVRAALGAGRWRIARGLAFEVIALAAIGVAGGLIAARLTIPHIALAGLPRASEVRIDLAVAAIAALLILGAAAVIGYGIAWWASRNDESLAERASTASVPATRMRAVLVATQVAIAVTLLTSGAMLLETYRRLRTVDLGFDPVNVLTFAVELPSGRYPRMAHRHAFFSELQQRLEALPGVVSASAVTNLPFSGNDWTGTFTVEGFEGETPVAHARSILPQYPATMRIPVLRGRAFTRTDVLATARVALIDEAAAKRFWPNQDPIGKRVQWGETWREVVGVIGSVRTSSLIDDAEPHLYFPLLQRGESQVYTVVRTGGDPHLLANGVRSLVRELDPGQPVYAMRTMEEYLDDAIAQPRLRAAVVAGSAIVAILLAVTGLYALLAYIVATRTREVGLRLALGATPAQMVRFIARWALRITAAGIVVGVAGAIVMTRSMRALLFGIDALDPATYAVVITIFAAVAIAAGALPALRAARVDPAIALRQE